MIALEPLFAIAIVVGAIHTQSFRLDTVLQRLGLRRPAASRGPG